MTGKPQDPTPGEQGGRSRPDDGGSAGEFSGVAFQFAISVIACTYLGQWADRKFGTAPWLLIIGVLGGAALSFYSMYGKLKVVQARDDAARAARRGGTP